MCGRVKYWFKLSFIQKRPQQKNHSTQTTSVLRQLKHLIIWFCQTNFSMINYNVKYTSETTTYEWIFMQKKKNNQTFKMNILFYLLVLTLKVNSRNISDRIANSIKIYYNGTLTILDWCGLLKFFSFFKLKFLTRKINFFWSVVGSRL